MEGGTAGRIEIAERPPTAAVVRRGLRGFSDGLRDHLAERRQAPVLVVQCSAKPQPRAKSPFPINELVNCRTVEDGS
jgi:hypothetical protein